MLDLTRNGFETLRSDGDFVLYRGRNIGDASRILLLSPATVSPSPIILRRLENEYSLREELDPTWSARPTAVARHMDRTVLALEDPGGILLESACRRVGPAAAGACGRKGDGLDLAFCLRVGINLTNAIGHLHRRGIVHKDIKPANVLVNSATAQVWLMGFGIASQLPRERQAPDPPEFLEGTLAYMAPEQTGRMNRSIDSRSDLYSLGVTLYQMVTGNLPFTASDPMEWVHCHIAKKPPPPSERLENVPKAVSAIIMKLLAKTAEERYQTAAGVESDLRLCLAEWEAGGHIDDFTLGQLDTPDRLLIPEKLYGRERESAALLAAFDRVVKSGAPELVLVSGYSGIGKSSVVNELHKVLVPPRGLFAAGKFDQYKRDIPYATLAQAFQSLVRPLLGKSDAELSGWRDALLGALGPNGRLMVDVVPELKLIIGEQPPLPELPPQDAQRRFQLVFRRFIGVFAKLEHPLALFLDDLQWLDAATLDLLEDLLTQVDVQHLLLVGAYRDNEVTLADPLMRKLDAIRSAGGMVTQITVAPLVREDLGQLIADALRCSPERVAPLTQLVHEKTGGNPFFAIQFVSSLAEERMLVFDHDAARWSWDLDGIHVKGYTDNVVDLMVGKLARLRTNVQNALQLLACLGNSAELTRLALVLEMSEEQVHAALWPAVHQELVERLAGAYRFAHDRVQEAAYSLIQEEQRGEAHVRIGRLLAAHIPPEKQEEAIFEIVSQLNRGMALVTTRDEREQLAALNLLAARRARASAAYASALTYLAAGASVLPDNAWDQHYRLTFDLGLLRVECELLNGSFDAAERGLMELLRQCKSKLDRAAASLLKIELHLIRSENARGVDTGLECLRLFGIEMSPHPTRTQFDSAFAAAWRRLGGRPIDSFIDLPRATNPDVEAAMRLLEALFSPAYCTDETLLHLGLCHMVDLTLQHGVTDASAHGFAWFGVMLGHVFGRYADGYQFGRLACALIERHGFTAHKARTLVWLEVVSLWTGPVAPALDTVRAAFLAAVETGDVFTACYACGHIVTDLLLRGDHLDEALREVDRGLVFVRQAKYRKIVDVLVSQQRFIQNMRGRTSSFSTFDGDDFDSAGFEAMLAPDRQPVMVFWYWVIKAKARFISGDFAEAARALEQAQPLQWACSGHIQLLDYHFFWALTLAALEPWEPSAPPATMQRARLELHREQLERWAQSCLATFAAKHGLVAAEIARIEARHFDAMALYEQAIRLAREHGFLHDEALAHELAARFYSVLGFETTANAYFRNARSCYARWGADGKVRQLDQAYPQLEHELPPVGPTSTIGAPVEQLDVATVIKVSQAVSGEIVLNKLIDRLLRIALEQAGAERGLLILERGNRHRIEAEVSSDRERVTVDFRKSPVTSADLPESLLRYVIRTRESVTLRDASAENLFSQDEYVRRKHPRSVFCLPLIKQGKLVGVLYLENNLAPGVFTSKQRAILELIASEAAISLEQARLYAELSQENSERKRAEEELRRSEAFMAQGQRISHTGSWRWQVATGAVSWSEEHFRIFGYDPETDKPSYVQFMERIHPEDRAPFDELLNRAVLDKSDFENHYRVVLPDGSIRFVRSVGQASVSPTGELEFIGTVMDVTDLKRAEEMQLAIAREREILMRRRAADLAKANEALRSCLDALASVPELDDFLGQVMVAITNQLGAVSSTLRLCNFEKNILSLELVYQEGRVFTPAEAGYPEHFWSWPLDKKEYSCFDQPTTVQHVADPRSAISAAKRDYLLALGVKTVLVIPLIWCGQAVGRLTFRFVLERDFSPEELEIAKALANQAALAIQLTRLAKTAKQSALLEERNQLAAEIHDTLAQSFTGISMQLGLAEEQLAAKEGDPLRQIQLANEIAMFGLAEARRSIVSLRSDDVEQSGLRVKLRGLVERSNVAGRLRCDFRSNNIPEESLPPRIQHQLLRIAQEAISNAVRHAKPTVVKVTLRWKPPNLILKVKDNGCGFSSASLKKKEGFGLTTMRTRAAQINGKLDIQTASGHGTIIVLTVPILA